MSLEVYISFFNIPEENNPIEIYTHTFEEFSPDELKDEIEEVLSLSDITPHHLQHGKIGPGIIEAYKKLRSKKSSTDGYTILLMGYARSPFRDFQSYYRIVVGLDEDDIQLISKRNESFLISYEISPDFQTNKDISEAVYSKGDKEGTLQIQNDDISMKTKPIVTRFGSTFGTLRFDEKSFV